MYYVDVKIKHSNGRETTFAEAERMLSDEFICCFTQHFRFDFTKDDWFFSELSLTPQQVYKEYAKFNRIYPTIDYGVRHTNNVFNKILRGLTSQDDKIILTLC